MFTVQIEDFGGLKKYYLADESGNALEIVPEHGACVLQVTLGGKSLLDGHSNATALRNNDWGKSALLFPFPNRLKDGHYSFEGKNYQFPINEVDRNNALHGFGLDQAFTVTQTTLSEKAATLELTYSYDGGRVYYPFPFQFVIRFHLSHGALDVEMTMTNTGSTSLPAGMGWHPYFQLTPRIEDTTLQLPVCDLISIDERMIPTGGRQPYTAFSTVKKIGETSLDNGFALPEKEGQATVSLSSTEGSLHYWQETGRGKYNFLQVFTPPARNCIALEPMTCNIDAFNNQDGLAILSPQQSLQARAGFSWTAL